MRFTGSELQGILKELEKLTFTLLLCHHYLPDSFSSPESEARLNGVANMPHPQTAFESKLDVHRFQQYVADERTRDAINPGSVFVSSLEGRTPPVQAAASGASVSAQTGNQDPRHLHQAKTSSGIPFDNQPSFLSQVSEATVIAGGPSMQKSGEYKPTFFF